MIKSDIKVKDRAEEQLTFPAMYADCAPGGTLVVLFSLPRVGTVLVGKKGTWQAGDYCSSWVVCTNREYWRRLVPDETVTIENS